MSELNNATAVQIVQMQNGELWQFKETERGWQPYKQIKTLIDLPPSDFTVTTQEQEGDHS